MVDKALSVTVSLYKRQIAQIKQFVEKSKRFNTESAFMQMLVDNYFGKRVTLKDVMLFIGYPLIFVGVMMYVANITDGINRDLLDEGFIVGELVFQNQIFYIIGFMFLGIAIAGGYYYVSKTRNGDV